MRNKSGADNEQPSDLGTNFRGAFPRRFFFKKAGFEDVSKGWRWPFLGNAAKIHLMEAKERYWILRREIEMHIDANARLLGIDNWRFNGEKGFSVERHIAQVEKDFQGKVENMLLSGTVVATGNTNKLDGSIRKGIDQFPRLLIYYKILLKDQSRLTRKYQNLNLLWRDMNFIRTRLLSDRLIERDRVPHQLDFCRIEAANLGLIDDPEIKTLLDQTAEEIDVSGENRSGSARKARRLIISLMVKLSDFRIRQIFEQIYKKHIYMALCFILLTLSVVLFEIAPEILNISPEVEVTGENKEAFNLGAVVPPVISPHEHAPKKLHAIQANIETPAWSKLLMISKKGYAWFTKKIVINPLVFIFFAGLTGGVFSAMMKFQPLNKLPGDELYIFWYRITKPIIGAFGAMVLYVIIVSPAFRGSVDAIVSAKVIDDLIKYPMSATGFTFGFLTGFTERIILPKLH